MAPGQQSALRGVRGWRRSRGRGRRRHRGSPGADAIALFRGYRGPPGGGGPNYGLYPITLNSTHLGGCGKQPWPPNQLFGGVHFANASVRASGNRPFFGVGTTMPNGSAATDVTGVVDVFAPAADDGACKEALGPLGASLQVRAACHRREA